MHIRPQPCEQVIIIAEQNGYSEKLIEWLKKTYRNRWVHSGVIMDIQNKRPEDELISDQETAMRESDTFI